MIKRLTLRNVQGRGYSGLARVFTILALLLTAATGAMAQTYTVSVKNGTEDATNWKAKAGDATEFAVMPQNVDAGTTVTVTYTGTKLVKSVKAKKGAPAGAISGKFTINAGGDKVYFSKGNLQAVFASAGSTCTWKFAANQWDYVGSAAANTSINGNGSVSAAGTVDLFGWSTASTTLGIYNSINYWDYSGDFADWGSNTNVKAGIGSGWRTLTSDEWYYLFFTRTCSTVNGTTNARYAKAYLFGTTHGVILFPNSYTHPSGLAAPTGINVTGSASWNANNYSAEDWAKMEAAGCVFLPAAAFRWGTTIYYENNIDYWTSSKQSAENAFPFEITEDAVSYQKSYVRASGCSVRLVHE